MNDFSNLGENVRRIREERGLNLNDVSELTGISKAMLSKIERGESVPTITNVWKIANGLKITLNELAMHEGEKPEVKRISEMQPFEEESGLFSLYDLFPFSPLEGTQIMYAIFKPGYHYSDGMFVHERSKKEYCIVFKGNLDVVVGDQTCSLTSGSAISFDCTKEHGYINTGEEDAVVCFVLI